MAIKSKGRARGGRAVAAAPRRPLVVRKPPIWRRPAVILVTFLLAFGGVLTMLVLSIQNHGRSGQAAQEKEAVLRLYNKIRQRLPDDVQPVPPDALVIFPSVQNDFSKFGTDIKGDDLTKRGSTISADAVASSTALDGLNIDTLVPKPYGTDRQTLTDARLLMSQAIKLYDEIGLLIGSTSTMTEDQSTAVMGEVQKLMNQAGTLFDNGYRKLTGVAKRLGIDTNSRFNPAPVLPPTPTPSESPSASPSGSAEPSASASASASESASAAPSESASPTASP
jgi:hypothetical protein